MDNLSMSFRLKNIVFEKDYLKLTDSKEGKYQISYEELVFVYLEAYSAESGEKSRLIRPALEDIKNSFHRFPNHITQHGCWSLLHG